MILFYNKLNGEVFATIDGRVHDERQMKCYIDNGIGKKNVGKYIIGWEEKKGKKLEHNMDKFELLQKFEDITPDNPLDYKIKDGKITLSERKSQKTVLKES